MPRDAIETEQFDPRPVWQSLSQEEQARLGHAALILAYAWRAADWVDGPRAAGFEAAELAAERVIADGLPAIALRQADSVGSGGDLDIPLPDLSVIGVRACRHCGCTDECACAGGCSWAGPDLCSACAAGGSEGFL